MNEQTKERMNEWHVHCMICPVSTEIKLMHTFPPIMTVRGTKSMLGFALSPAHKTECS